VCGLCVTMTKRIMAGIVACMLFVLMLFSALYIACETAHDCAGEECPVCACLQQCDNTLHQTFDGTVMLSVIVPFSMILLSVIPVRSELSGKTLVSAKVRMDN